MEWGMANRMHRMFSPVSGNAVMVAVDHGYFMGPTRRLENARATIAPLLPYADALGVTRGVLRHAIDPTATTPILLRVSGGVTVLKEDLSNEEIMTSMEDEARLNVGAVVLCAIDGAQHEHESEHHPS